MSNAATTTPSVKKKKKNKNKNKGTLSTTNPVELEPESKVVEITLGSEAAAALKQKAPEVTIIPLGQNNSCASLSVVNQTGEEAGATGGSSKNKKKKKKKKGQQQQQPTEEVQLDSVESSPAVTVIPLNKDPGTIPSHLNPAVVLTKQESENSAPRIIQASPVVTLIGSNKKAKGHGALYNPPPLPQLPPTPIEEPTSGEQTTISGGFKFPSSLQPVFETPESIAHTTGVVLNTETSGVLTIVPVRQEGEKKRRNRNKIIPPCCELRGTSGLEVVCPHSNKPIANYNFIVNEDREKYLQFQETQETLQRIENQEVLDTLAGIGTSVTIKLVGGGLTERTVHSEAIENRKIVVEAGEAMTKQTVATTNGIKPEDAEKARLKAERKAAFEAARAAELAAKGGDGSGKENKKTLTKAERRAIQEAQRAKKEQEAAEKKAPQPKDTQNKKLAAPEAPKKEDSPIERRRETPAKKVSFADMKFAANPFVNMHRRRDNLDNLLRERRKIRDDGHKKYSIHPAILQLGFQIADGAISGANNRCVGLLNALKKLTEEFGACPECAEIKNTRELMKELTTRIEYNVSFLRECRPLSVSMLNALQHVKCSMCEEWDMTEAKVLADVIIETIDNFLQNELGLARQAIVEAAKSKISDGDVVLTFARSSLVLEVLKACHDEGKQFSVVIVDSRPKLEGREILKQLCRKGIRCKYVLIHAVSYIMKEVTKVFLGADTLLANGYVASRVGSAQISMIAHKLNVPVLVCCETYKFTDKVLADCFAGNELGSQREFLQNLSEDRKHLLSTTLSASVSLVDLTYDITPPEFVTMVVTERGTLPCTSVPVVLRVRHNILM